MAFTARNVLRQRLTTFSSEYYQIPTATHLPTPEGWKAELSGAPLAHGYKSTVVPVGIEPATSVSLVRDLTTTPPGHVRLI